MEKKENQRIKLTKQLLSDALISMLQEMPIHSVSIRELCERAGINRTTFYNHYGSQYDLLEDMGQRFLETIGQRLAGADAESRESVQEQVTTVLEYLNDNVELSRLLLNNDSETDFARRVLSVPHISDLLDSSLKNCSDPERRSAVITFAICGSCRLLQEWIAKDSRIPAEEEAALILELARKVCE